MKTIKTTIEDWYDNLIFNLRHLRVNIQSFCTGLGRWLSYFKVLINVYDFDYSSILTVERYQIIRVKDAIMKYQSHMNWKRDVQHMNLALKLLDIIEKDECAELIGPGFRTEPYKDDLYRLVSNPDSKWVMPIYVNTTNSERFCKISKDKFEDPKVGPLMKDHLRVQKAWYLYHKLRTYHMKSWWD